MSDTRNALNLFREIVYICDHSMDGRKVPSPRNSRLIMPQRSCSSNEMSCLKEQRIFITRDCTCRNLAVALGIHTGRYDGERFVVFTEEDLCKHLPVCYEYSSERFLLIIAHILRVSLKAEDLPEEFKTWGSTEDEHFGDLALLWPRCRIEYDKFLAGDNTDLNDMQLLFFVRFGIQVKLPQPLLGEVRQALYCRLEQRQYVSDPRYRTTIWNLVLNIEHDPIVGWLLSDKAQGIDRGYIFGNILSPLPSIVLELDDDLLRAEAVGKINVALRELEDFGNIDERIYYVFAKLKSENAIPQDYTVDEYWEACGGSIDDSLFEEVLEYMRLIGYQVEEVGYELSMSDQSRSLELAFAWHEAEDARRRQQRQEYKRSCRRAKKRKMKRLRAGLE